MVAIPILVYWSLAIWGVVSRRPVLLYLFFGSLSFGSLAVIPTAATAGLTFVPASMTALLIIVTTLADRQRALIALGSALSVRRMAVLAAFWVCAVITTLFAPRLFAGSVMVITMRGDVSGPSPLFPSTQNISQLAYLTISILVTFAFTQVLKTTALRQTALNALVFGCLMAILTGFADFASQFAPIGPFLELFRTASYAMHVDVEVHGGGKRVVGLLPEASSYGGLCLSLLCMLYFLRRAIQSDRVRDVYAPLLILGLFLFAWLSTSSAAYVGLAIFLAMAAVEWCLRAVDRRYSPLRRRHLGLEFTLAASALAALVVIILVKPALLDAVLQTIDEIVFQKSESSSYTERNMWTAVSLQSLFDTFGFGVGMGSTRASNIFVATVSSVGAVGAFFYFLFIAQCIFCKPAPSDYEGAVLLSALRYAIIPPFVVGLLIGTTADFGSLGAFRYGLMMAIGMGGLSYSLKQRRPARRFAQAN